MSVLSIFYFQDSPFTVGTVNQDFCNIVADWQRLINEDVNINNTPIKQFRIQYNEFKTIEHIKQFFKEVILKDFIGSDAKKEQSCDYLLTAFHQGGLMYPVSASASNQLYDKAGLQAHASRFMRKIFIAATDEGFKIQEIYTTKSLLISNTDHAPKTLLTVVADLDEPVLHPDLGESYIFKASALINVDFSAENEEPLITVERNEIAYGNKEVQRVLSRRSSEEMLAYLKGKQLYLVCSPFAPNEKLEIIKALQGQLKDLIIDYQGLLYMCKDLKTDGRKIVLEALRDHLKNIIKDYKQLLNLCKIFEDEPELLKLVIRESNILNDGRQLFDFLFHHVSSGLNRGFTAFVITLLNDMLCDIIKNGAQLVSICSLLAPEKKLEVITTLKDKLKDLITDYQTLMNICRDLEENGRKIVLETLQEHLKDIINDNKQQENMCKILEHEPEQKNLVRNRYAFFANTTSRELRHDSERTCAMASRKQ